MYEYMHDTCILQSLDYVCCVCAFILSMLNLTLCNTVFFCHIESMSLAKKLCGAFLLSNNRVLKWLADGGLRIA